MRLPCTRATSVSARKLETFGSACVPQAEFECPQVRNPRSFPTGAFYNVTGSAGFSGAGQTPWSAADAVAGLHAEGRPGGRPQTRGPPHKWRAVIL
jgi:hypothetical protein